MAAAKFSLRDNSREIGRTDITIRDITVDSIGDVLTDFGDLRTAIEGITLGVMAKESLVMDETTLSALAPASTLAQRGVKWAVTYIDNQPFFDPPVNAIPNAGYQKPFTNHIPTADLSLLESGQEELDLTAGPGLAFKNAWEALARSPYGGNTLVISVKYVD